MSLHDVFTVLCVIAYIVFVALAVYAVKKKKHFTDAGCAGNFQFL